MAMSWVVAAYTVFWVAIFGYTISMSRKQKELDRRIEALRKLIAEGKDSSNY